MRSGLQSYTPKTLTSVNLPRKEHQSLAQGHTIDDEEHALGLNCPASAIFDRNNNVIAAISISGPSSRVGKERFKELGELVGEVARDIAPRWANRAARRNVARRLNRRGEDTPFDEQTGFLTAILIWKNFPIN